MRREATPPKSIINHGPQAHLDHMRNRRVARLTGLEPATPGVTGRYSNQLSYNRPLHV